MLIREITSEDTLDIRHKVMWPHKPIAFVRVPEDREGTHLGLFVDDRLVSIISLFTKDNVLQFRKFATISDQQSKGYGTALLRYVMNLAEKKGIEKIWCNARVTKQDYYKGFGLKSTDQTFEKEGLLYVVMEKLF